MNNLKILKETNLIAFRDNQKLIQLTQYEHGESGVKCYLFDSQKQPIDLTDCLQANYYGTKADDTTIGRECLIEDNTVIIPIKLQMTTCPGNLKGILECVFDNGNIRFYGVNFVIGESPNVDKIESTDDFNILEKSIAEVQELLKFSDAKLDKPTTDGTTGQVLTLADDGTTKWTTPTGGGGASGGITYEQVKTLIEPKEDISNKITTFDSLLTDKDKYPTAIAVMNYLKDYYYSADEIDGMILDSGGTSGGNTGEDDNTSGDDGDSSVNADTSPKIAQTDVGYQAISTNIPIISSREGMCITKPYSFSPVKEKAIELGYYNADTDMWNSIAHMPRIKYYIPNTKYLENGYSDSAISRYSKIVLLADENIVMGISNTSYSTNAEATLSVGSTSKTNTGNANNIAFSLFEDDGDDSYAYWTNMGNDAVLLPDGIRDGDIIFAGKNTKYYGMKNIDGTMLNDSTSSSELSVDDDYAQNYGISTLALVTDEAETLATNTGLDVNWAKAVETAKNAWMLEANGNVNKIPLIIHTDQHGNYSSSLYKAISKMVNWYDISKVINLGDTVNSWVDADTEHPLTISDKLEKYLKVTETIPNSKRIEVFGNHDVWTTNDEGKEIGVAPQNHLRKYFRNIYARQKDNYGNFVLTDDVYNIKYLVVSGFAFDAEIGGKSRFIINPDSLKWIISEMEKVDGYDLIILSHCPLGTEETVSYYDSIDGTSEEKTVSGLSSVSFKTLEALWSGRKSKTSGSVTDEYGNTHNFNFTNCDGELLCGLHGHQHANKYYYIGELLDVVFDSYNFNNESIHFVLVDRENRQLNVWRVDSTPQCQNYQIPFNKTNIS